MDLNETQQDLLRRLPGVDHILNLIQADPCFERVPQGVLTRTIRTVVAETRARVLAGKRPLQRADLSDTSILEQVKRQAAAAMAPNLRPLINATGVVVHTNLGRSLLAGAAVQSIGTIADRYSNLEFELALGQRGSRYSHIEDLLCELTGAEAGMAVNNNAGAVLLCLETIARGCKVIVSRGELVEIGGSFRIPDVMAKSGGILTEVGTTNRTHLRDYETAIEAETALLLKVHKSNYSVVGFTAEVTLKELVALGRRTSLPVMEDLGSGTLIDFSHYGMLKEPTVQESVAAGVDVVTFSGDKLLGGPQAGLIVGKRSILEKIKQNPLTRALRLDKLTLASLESTLRLYRDEKRAVTEIPTLRMLTLPFTALAAKARKLEMLLMELANQRLRIQLLDRSSRAGGGALPLLDLPSKCLAVSVEGISANGMERFMRRGTPPIIGRIEEDLFIMDPRTIQDDEFPAIQNAFKELLNGTPSE